MTKNEFIYPTGCSMTQWNEDCEKNQGGGRKNTQ